MTNRSCHTDVKKPIVMESQYLAPIQYYAAIQAAEVVWIDAHEHFVKSTYRNRCYIAAANGVQCLSIPLAKGKNQRTPMKEVRISYDINWQKQHWHSILAAYRNAPYFEYYEEEIAPFYQRTYEFLLDFNQALFEVIGQCIDLQANAKLSESYMEMTTDDRRLDARSAIHPNAAKAEKLFPFSAPRYWQVFEDKIGFQPNLSIIDLLFCEGPNAQILLQQSLK